IPGSEWALQQAKRNVLEKYTLVGVTEQMGEYLQMLELIIPGGMFRNASEHFKHSSKSHLRKTAKKYPVSRKTIQKFHDSTIWQMENELYAFVAREFAFAYAKQFPNVSSGLSGPLLIPSTWTSTIGVDSTRAACTSRSVSFWPSRPTCRLHQLDSLSNRKANLKLKIESLFRQLIVYTDTKKKRKNTTLDRQLKSERLQVNELDIENYYALAEKTSSSSIMLYLFSKRKIEKKSPVVILSEGLLCQYPKEVWEISHQ
ncbi:hypothetical protein ACI65C_004234, partial [Semiaphis heraclei]